jgi:hypothetical protein
MRIPDEIFEDLRRQINNQNYPSFSATATAKGAS